MTFKLLSAGILLVVAQAAAPESITLRAARVLDGTGKIITDGVVEIRGAKIVAVDARKGVVTRDLGDVTLMPVDAVEQRVERRTQIEAAPAAIADFVDALRAFLKLRGIDGVDQTQAIHGWGKHALSHQPSATLVTFLRFIWFIAFLWFESDKPNRPHKRDRPNAR